MRFYSTVLIFFLSLIMLSCEKEVDSPPVTHSVEGLWIGTYTTDQFPQYGSLYYSFIIKPGGKLLTEGKASNGATYYSAGTWTLNSDTLRCTYTTINFPDVAVTQSAKFVFNSSEGTLTAGTWKDEENGSDYTGKFQNMTEVK